MMSDRDRGQAYTLEGIIAALLLLSSVLLALQAVSITPTTPGTIDRDARAQLRTQAQDVLAVSHESGALKQAVLQWNTSTGAFYDPDYDDYNISREFGYGPKRPPNDFGRMLNETFAQRGFNVNVYIEYRSGSDWTETERRVLIRRGIPTDNAVSATHVVTLYDDMQLTAGSYERLGDLDPADFYAKDIYPNGPIYNIVRVRVVIW
jgi:hypothetical protein